MGTVPYLKGTRLHTKPKKVGDPLRENGGVYLSQKGQKKAAPLKNWERQECHLNEEPFEKRKGKNANKKQGRLRRKKKAHGTEKFKRAGPATFKRDSPQRKRELMKKPGRGESLPIKAGNWRFRVTKGRGASHRPMSATSQEWKQRKSK